MYLSLSKKPNRGRHGLMREVAPDLALAGLRIVRRADARQQKQLHVEQRERAKEHKIGRLLEFFAGRIHISHAGCALAGIIEIDLA